MDDLERTGDDEAERIQAFALVEEHVSGRPVAEIEVDGKRAQAAVGGEAEGGVFVEDAPVEMDADVRLHVRRAVVEHLEE